MKTLAPILCANDIDILNPKLYNTEFFCGYLPEWWITQFNDSLNDSNVISTPINNRNARTANVTSFNELKKIVQKTKEYSTDVFCVLNAKYYPNYVYSYIKQYIDELVSAGINRLIVTDVGMIKYLENNYPNIRVSVSCLNQVTNTRAVQFYKNFKNVDRIVLPRHMSTNEILKIVNTYPDMEFEFFIFSNKCLYDDGYCRSIHEFTPICKDIAFSEYYRRDGSIISDNQIVELRKNESAFLYWTNNEKFSVEKKNCSANFGCMACSLFQLHKETNIVSVKLSIRGHCINEILQQVKMANRVICCAQKAKDVNDIKLIVSRLHGKDNVCDEGNACMMI